MTGPLDIVVAPLLWLKHVLLPPKFVVRIRNGAVASTRGRVPRGFLGDCNEIASHFEITNGTVYGTNSKHGVRLSFSLGIPRESHQRFRNAFQTSQI